jgi:hypothetical protein
MKIQTIIKTYMPIRLSQNLLDDEDSDMKEEDEEEEEDTDTR